MVKTPPMKLRRGKLMVVKYGKEPRAKGPMKSLESGPWLLVPTLAKLSAWIFDRGILTAPMPPDTVMRLGGMM